MFFCVQQSGRFVFLYRHNAAVTAVLVPLGLLVLIWFVVIMLNMFGGD